MKTLQEFLEKTQEISNIIEYVGVSCANGINTTTSMIDTLKQYIEANDFSHTRFQDLFNDSNKQKLNTDTLIKLKSDFQQFKKDLPSINEKLNFDFLSSFSNIFERYDFIEQWNSLNETQKSILLNVDDEIYSIIRKKLDINEFDFLFNHYEQKYTHIIPEEIQKWINVSSNLYKLRKESEKTSHKNFFHSDIVSFAEKNISQHREKIAICYLTAPDYFLKTNFSWYTRLDLLTNQDIKSHYIYDHFKKLEDKFNGYDQIQKIIQIPDILKKWVGKIPSSLEPLLQKEQDEFKKLLSEGKDIDDVSNIYKSIPEKFPILQLSHDLQKGFSEDEFLELIQDAKGTEFEEFFNQPITKKISSEMPYKRIDYMFIYYRETFINQKKQKL